MSKFKVGDYVRAPRDIVHGAFAKDWVGKVTSVWDGRMVVHTARVNPGWETTDHVGKVHEQLTPSELELASAPLDTRGAETDRFPCLVPMFNGTESNAVEDEVAQLEKALHEARCRKHKGKMNQMDAAFARLEVLSKEQRGIWDSLKSFRIPKEECPYKAENHASRSEPDHMEGHCRYCNAYVPSLVRR